MTKKLDHRKSEYSGNLYLDGMTLSEIAETHEAFIEQTGVERDTVKIDTDYGMYDESDHFRWFGRRQETGAERDRRLAKDKKDREAKAAKKAADEQKERKEYERLKKKFGA